LKVRRIFWRWGEVIRVCEDMSEGGLYSTIPPHCGRMNASAFVGLPESSSICKGLREADGIKRTKWRTGSFDALEAYEMLSYVIDVQMEKRTYTRSIRLN
jgi:hypothetical protein